MLYPHLDFTKGAKPCLIYCKRSSLECIAEAQIRSNGKQVVAVVSELILILPLASRDTLGSFFELWISCDLEVHSSGLIQVRTFCSSILTQRSTKAWLGATSGEKTIPSKRAYCSDWRVCLSAIGSFQVTSCGPEGWSTLRWRSFRANACDSTTSLLMHEVWYGFNSLAVTFDSYASRTVSVTCWGVVETAKANDPKVSKPWSCNSTFISSSTPNCFNLSAKATFLSSADNFDQRQLNILDHLGPVCSDSMTWWII